MDILIHLTVILSIAGLFFLLRFSENPLIYGSIIVVSSIGLILSLVSGVYLVTGEEQQYTYISTCGNNTSNNCIDKIEITSITQDLGVWKYIFDLAYLGFLIGSIIFWTYSNPRREEY